MERQPELWPAKILLKVHVCVPIFDCHATLHCQKVVHMWESNPQTICFHDSLKKYARIYFSLLLEMRKQWYKDEAHYLSCRMEQGMPPRSNQSDYIMLMATVTDHNWVSQTLPWALSVRISEKIIFSHVGCCANIKYTMSYQWLLSLPHEKNALA